MLGAEVHKTSEFHRCVESQAHSSMRHVTDDQAEFDFIEEFCEESKPRYPDFDGWDILIQTPFRYPIPNGYADRFKPPFFRKNVFYASKNLMTCLYETSYYFLRQRVHLQNLSQSPESRTCFRAKVDLKNSVDICNHENIDNIMDKYNHSNSHTFINNNQEIDVLLYPSCRCPNNGINVAVFDINSIGKKPANLVNLDYIYDSKNKSVRIFARSKCEAHVTWEEVS